MSNHCPLKGRNAPPFAATVSRRSVLAAGGAGLSCLLLGRALTGAPGAAPAAEPTKFQIACMTLPYSQFPLRRALTGIKEAGYRHVAWGITHQEEGGRRVPLMPADAPPEKAKALGQACRDMGLEPVMMFSEVYPEHDNAVAVLTSRIKQAAAAGIGQVLTFGHTEQG